MKPLLVAALLFFPGCRSNTSNQKAAETSLREAHIDSSTTATVAGRVTFLGPAPQRRKLDLSANPTCERQHLRPVLSEDVVVNKNGTLKNTLVWVTGGLPAVRWIAPATPVSLDQEGCIYLPHVLALMAGQTLEVSNADSLNHNVHAESVVNTAFNVAQAPRAEKLFERFEHQEIMIPVTCGVHGWMRAYVSVIGHPFYAVTGDDGSFEIKGLPPGAYTLEAVHETYGRRELAQVTVGARERKGIEFTYTAEAR